MVSTRSIASFGYVLVVSAFLAAAMPNGGGPGHTTTKPPPTTPTPPPVTTKTTTVTTPVTTTVTVTPPAAPTVPASQCNTGPVQCCNSVQQAGAPDAKALLGLLNIDVSDITALVGLTCVPITLIGIGGNSCTAQPVCCQNNNFNGLIAIGCVPVSL
ncbi:fungal hydrophobin-domain-containing protein [Crepidotus variabilis]|uniref:Hydrophobin n=1 Tax=Crepidotus variabilis TaxID=179855 RepID=A0A9P6E998_9AGAR|nr:fungal hydrophobin-domain-containing protein [Crepidotus variabilis]